MVADSTQEVQSELSPLKEEQENPESSLAIRHSSGGRRLPYLFRPRQPHQNRFPLNYSRRRIRLLWRESTPPFRGSSGSRAQTVYLVGLVYLVI